MPLAQHVLSSVKLLCTPSNYHADLVMKSCPPLIDSAHCLSVSLGKRSSCYTLNKRPSLFISSHPVAFMCHLTVNAACQKSSLGSTELAVPDSYQLAARRARDLVRAAGVSSSGVSAVETMSSSLPACMPTYLAQISASFVYAAA